MMIGESHRHNPTWPLVDDPTASVCFPFRGVSSSSSDANGYCDGVGGDYSDQYSSLALQRFLPSNDVSVGDFDSDSDVSDIPVDAFSCDQFRMFEFKVRRCARARSHDWTDCPYAHPGEKARRRDPRRYHYCGTACPDFRKGSCRKGDACEYAHGVFECWLHPARYRTQPCKDGTNCRRRVCFFAHTPEQLRVLPLSPSALPVSSGGDLYDGSPLRHAIEVASCAKTLPFNSSPPMTPPSDSPPLSPITRSLSRSLGSNSANEMGPNSVHEVAASLRNLQLSEMKSMPAASWAGSPVFGSFPKGPILRPGSYSLPSTPTGTTTHPGLGYLGFWEEEPEMERVESGRDLRARMFEKLCKEKSMDRVNRSSITGCGGPDVGWVSELLQ